VLGVAFTVLQVDEEAGANLVTTDPEVTLGTAYLSSGLRTDYSVLKVNLIPKITRSTVASVDIGEFDQRCGT
jgi:hypothetical protein